MRTKLVSVGTVLIVAVATAGVVVTAAGAVTTPAILRSARVTVTATSQAHPNLRQPVEYDPTNTTSVTGSATTSEVHVAVVGGTAGRTFALDLIAPKGERFERRTYFGDDPYGVRGQGSIDEDNLGCQFAQFTIVDIAATGSTLTRLDVRFQTNCGSASNVNGLVFGEVQLGEPEAVAGIVTGARSPSWPTVAVGVASSARMPLYVRNTGARPVTLGAVTRSGADPADFPIVSDRCSRRVLAAHTGCAVSVAFAPSTGGTRSAVVTVPVGSKRVRTTLSGTGAPGRTQLRMTSERGDFVGAGQTYAIPDSRAQVQVSARLGPNTVFQNFTDDAGTQSWNLEVGAPDGAPMTLGVHTTAAAGGGGHWGLDVTGNGRGCGDSTGRLNVKQLRFNHDGAPSAFRMTFRQVCSDSTAALTGEIEYHAR